MRNNPFKTLLKYSDQETNDVLGAYPEKLHVRSLPERRYLKTTRTLTIFSIISLSVTILLASIVYILAPQRTVDILLLTKDKEITGLQEVAKTEVNTNAINLYVEKFVMNYVILRHGVTADVDALLDKSDDKKPNNKFALMHPGRGTILREAQEDIKSIKNRLLKEGLTRSVHIVWSRQLSSYVIDEKNDVLFLVRFETLDLKYEKPDKNIKIWESLIRLRMNKSLPRLDATSDKNMLLKREAIVENNPLNIRVTNYVLTYVGEREFK